MELFLQVCKQEKVSWARSGEQNGCCNISNSPSSMVAFLRAGLYEGALLWWYNTSFYNFYFVYSKSSAFRYAESNKPLTVRDIRKKILVMTLEYDGVPWTSWAHVSRSYFVICFQDPRLIHVKMSSQKIFSNVTEIIIQSAFCLYVNILCTHLVDFSHYKVFNQNWLCSAKWNIQRSCCLYLMVNCLSVIISWFTLAIISAVIDVSWRPERCHLQGGFSIA